MKKICFFLIALLLPLSVWAADGYVFGGNHCFYFDTPAGWVADNQSGKEQGLAFVFYPEGSNYEEAVTFIYTMVVDKAKTLKNPKDQVRQTLERFHAQGNPNSKAVKIGKIKSQSGAIGEIYKFTGDKFGNTELVVYFTGRETINFFVMTSSDAEDLTLKVRALEELAWSYREGDDCKPCNDPTNPSPCKDT